MQSAVAEAIKGIGPEHAFRLLIQLLMSEEKAGWGVSYVLGEIGAATVPELVAVLESGSRLARVHACSAIREIGSEAIGAVPILIRLLRDDDDFVRWEAARTLATIQGP